jgi:hypothetical protein
MNKLKLYENEFGFYIDYIFSDKDIKKCLRLSEDDDYFSFSIFSPNIHLVNSETISINSNNPIFLPLKNLIENNPYIEILEEGSNEEKSIIFKNNENNIDIIFNLTSIPTNVASVSLTNIRLSSPNVTFGKNSPKISDFKNKLNSALLNIRNTLKEKHM